MLYYFLYPFASEHILFNVFRYISFRTIMASLTALMISFLLGRVVIDYLRAIQLGEMIREDVPQSHKQKSGTPTMGGLLILFALTTSCLLWTRLDNLYLWMVLGITVSYGFIGFLDDYYKTVHKNHKAISGKRRLLMELLLGGLVGFVLWWDPTFKTTLAVPFFKDFQPDLGIWYIPFAALVIAGAANAVNLTDGLDGLAIGPVMICGGTYLVFAYMTGHLKLAQYLQITYVAGSGELVVVLGAMIGASLGFLWYNAYPAEIFMGDVGSLSLGGLLGAIAVVTKHEILLVIAGGVFVIEAVSVILQVASFKTTGRRVFNMAPIHHHFELKGWAEPKVIVRFWIISLFFALMAVSTLKLR